jgi:hypothetical protein
VSNDESEEDSVPESKPEPPKESQHKVKPRKGQDDEDDADSSNEKESSGKIDLERSVAEANQQ